MYEIEEEEVGEKLEREVRGSTLRDKQGEVAALDASSLSYSPCDRVLVILLFPFMLVLETAGPFLNHPSHVLLNCLRERASTLEWMTYR